MQVNLADFIRNTPDGDEAEAILHKCVHCGFCTAACPTYQLLGDELDGPRGRIYLIKQMVEGAPVTRHTQLHLDRCLTCRSCESACPSGVEYGRLLEIGRAHIEKRAPRPIRQRLFRRFVAHFAAKSALFSPAMRLGQYVRALLPRQLRDKIPMRQRQLTWPTTTHERKMLLLTGCVQPAMLPNINIATARVFDALGIELINVTGCCGAMRLHLGYRDEALNDMRRNIDAWWPYIEQGIEAIVINASGCGLSDYARLLRHDPLYAEKARRISELARDVAQILPDYQATLVSLAHRRNVHTVAFHPPCTLQHGQQIRGVVEHLLRALDIETRVPADSHLCCGSAGAYSLLQPTLSYALRDRKLKALHALEPQIIVSANVGCITHLQSATTVPVAHWIELVDYLLFG